MDELVVAGGPRRAADVPGRAAAVLGLAQAVVGRRAAAVVGRDVAGASSAAGCWRCLAVRIRS